MEEFITTTTSDRDYINYVKQRLKSVCLAEKFCGLCLETEGDLNSLGLEFIINKLKYPMCLHDILNYVFHDDIKNLTSSSYVCKTCTDKVVQCYSFIHNVKQTMKIVENCVDDLSTKIDYVNYQFDTTFELDSSIMLAADFDNNDLYYSIINTDITKIMPVVYPRIIDVQEEEDLETNDSISPSVKAIKVRKKPGRKRIHLPTDTFPCKFCPKIYKLNKHVLRHQREVHYKVWDCDLCDQYYTSKKEFKAHYRTHAQEINSASNLKDLAFTSQTSKVNINEIRLTNEIPKNTVTKKVVKSPENVTCADCSEKFPTNRALRTHVKVIHNKSYYECDLCEQSYTTWMYLIKHYNSVHDMEKCKHCSQIFPIKEFMQHLKTEHLDLVFPCRFCDLVYYSSDSLVTHFHVSHLINTNEEESQCVMCLKEVDPDRLKYHRIRCRYSCQECFVMPCIHYKYLAFYREQVLNNAKKFKCLDCNDTFSSKLGLVGHINHEHLDHHPFTCDYCQQQFYSKQKLKNHIVLFHLDNRCEYCDVVFFYIDGLENHRKLCKMMVRLFSCDKCKASFDSEEHLSSHKALRHNDNAYACGHCSCTFLEYTELEEHIEREHSGVLRPSDKSKRMKYVQCSLCDMELKDVEEVNQHQKEHSHKDKFTCIKCGEEFSNLLVLYSHNLKHKMVKTVKCKYCNKKVQASRHREHEACCYYRSNKGLQHICEDCGMGFCSKSSLNHHAKKHKAKTPCPECGKQTKDVQRHIRLVHDPNKSRRRRHVTQFRCEVCGVTFQSRRPLDAHMNRFHLKIKPYSCQICSQTFFGENRLSSHMLTHTDEKVCFCSVCGKRYSDPVCLKRHFRTHTGDLPYCCDLCGEQFRTSSLMNVHRLKKHFEKTISCPLCDNMFHVLGEMRSHFRSVHWKVKDRPFNVREVSGLSEEHYHLFEDRRFPKY